jgi:diguanylate cyclase (GGDEF)-like protein/PAS domain S-box-containing protein
VTDILEEAVATSGDTNSLNPPWALFESIVVKANDVVLVTEAEPVESAVGGPRVVYVNPAFTRMTGYLPADIIGRTPRILHSPKTDRRELDRLRQALKRWEPVEVELLNVHKDGTEFWVQINITPIADETGWWTHWVAIQRDITARRRRETAVGAMLESTSDLMVVVNKEIMTSVSPSARRLLGLASTGLVGRPISSLAHPDDLATLNLLLAPVGGIRLGHSAKAEMRLRRGDGSWCWVEMSAADLGPDPGSGVVLACADLSERKHAERQLKIVNDRLRSSFDDAPIGMAITEPGGRFVQANAALAELLQLDLPTLLGLSIHDVTHPDDVETGRLNRLALLTGGTTIHRYETRFVDGSGSVVGVLHSSSVLPGADGLPQHLVDHIENITDRKAFEAHLRHQALHDPLTGLPNRALLVDRLEHALGASARSQATIAVIFLDLDRFKIINDSLGHQIGDQVLTTVATRLRAALRPGDTASRLSGDEFVVLCENSSPVHAGTTADRLGAVLATPIPVGDSSVTVSASIGIALSQGNTCTADSLLRDADAAMYSAKDRGRDRVEVFDETLGADIRNRQQLEMQLRAGITQGQLRLHYQPEINLATGIAAGSEALVRWLHPDRGLLSPGDFISLAEDTGLISQLGAWVLDEALGEAAFRRARTPQPSIMWVNLSAHQIQDPRLVQDVRIALAKHGLPGAALGLEITESVLMRDFQAARHTLLELREMGIALAIDDFGTGYSSLSYLARFPVDTIKIDMYFTSGLDDDDRRRESFAIVNAVVGIAHALDLRVVAEGVETITQAQILHGLGCDLGQGYLLGRPGASERDLSHDRKQLNSASPMI